MKRRCTECVIGVLTEDGSGKLMTYPSLLKHIERQRELYNLYNSNKAKVLFEGALDKPITVYSMEDYLSGKKRTDLFRFSCCPICGNPINYRELVDINTDI